ETDTHVNRPRIAAAGFRTTGGAGLPMGQESNLVDVIQQAVNAGPAEAVPGRVVLAAATLDVPDDQLLRAGDARHNEQVVRANLSRHREMMRDINRGDREARLAAICPPLTTIRDVVVAGTDSTPVADAFSWLNSEGNGQNALGFEYRLPTSMTTVGDGVGVWTEALQ